MSAAKHARVESEELSLNNPHDMGNRPSKLPDWVQWAGITLLVAAVAMSGIWAITEHWRRATFALGAGIIWLGVLRLTCDSRILGVLAVRSVRFDTFFCFVVGGAMTFLSASVDALGS